MQQDNKNINIETRLNQLENQQLPDLSNMDKHWQAMELMLQANGKSKPARSVSFFTLYARKLFIAASVIAVLIAAWYFRNSFGNASKVVIVPTAKAPAASPVNKEEKVNNNPLPVATTVNPATTTQTDAPHTHRPALNIAQSVSSVAEDIAAADEAYAREAIASFYRKIQNPVQEFNINAEKGGIITGSEGTVFTIPAAAFVDESGRIITGDVKINLEEFYRYADMVAANLSTLSNGKLLTSGGMVRITATANGNKLNLRQNREISLNMPASSYDPEMKLFTTQSETGDKIESAMYASYPAQERNLNWELTGKQNTYIVFDGKTMVPDRLDQPYSVIRTGKKTTAKFALSKKSSLTPAQMEEILKEKFSDDYDVIKVIRDGEPRKASTFLHRGTIDMESVIGDSIRLTLQHALRGKYIEKKDSSLYAERIKTDSVRFMNEYAGKQTSYAFSIQKLGWVNCDKYCNLANKKDIVINLPEGVKAEKFVSHIVFSSSRSSVIPGRSAGNQISFREVPSNINAFVVGLGYVNGKVVSFMEKLRTDKAEIEVSDLQETTPDAFRKKLSLLDLK
ncbi:MAG: hypothetical protein JST81_02380 [Bacteroidetes bacterium]|nr:hypothetical protein [Bacteroidota bacterium]